MSDYQGPLDSLGDFRTEESPQSFPQDTMVLSQHWVLTPNSPPQARRSQLDKYTRDLKLHQVLAVPDASSTRLDEFYRTGVEIGDGFTREHSETNFNWMSRVFCHRGLYDNALFIPENSKSAIENGVKQGFLLHDLDVAVSKESDQRALAYLAHDDSARRVTARNVMFQDMAHETKVQLRLVCRPWGTDKNDWARCYVETQDRVLDLDEALSLLNGPGSMARPNAFQLDVKGKDFAKIFKGNNRFFKSGHALKEAVERFSNARGEWPDWKRKGYDRDGDPAQTKRSSRNSTQAIIMVFFAEPIVKLAEQSIADDKDGALSDEHLYSTARTHICSFHRHEDLWLFPNHPRNCDEWSRAGVQSKSEPVTNPWDGSVIEDPGKSTHSCPLDHARESTMPGAPRGERGGRIQELGRAVSGKEGDQGISEKLRCIPGGLYPQSDIAIAEDPFLEVAARTWMDEYARLDRSRLLEIPYWKWIEEGDRQTPGLLDAIKKLNEPFMPNTFAESALTDRQNLKVADELF
ncbi:hypothetical protein BDV12DRAFT_201830 [Aspergillus spectabilis]